jgi:hypothetical protein
VFTGNVTELEVAANNFRRPTEAQQASGSPAPPGNGARTGARWRLHLSRLRDVKMLAETVRS